MRLKLGVLLAISCVGTAVAMAVSESGSAGTNDESSEVVGAVVKPASRSAERMATAAEPQDDLHFDLNAVKRSFPGKSHDGGLFQPKSWYVAPPPPKVVAAPVAPPAPVAPGMPFTFIGRMIDGKEEVLFLYKNGRQYTVRQGDTVDGTYRVDSIGETQAKLTYLPMNEQQTLAFNSRLLSSVPAEPKPAAAGRQPDAAPVGESRVATSDPIDMQAPMAPPTHAPGVTPGAAGAPPAGAFVAPVPDRTAVAAMPFPPQLSQQQLQQLQQMQQQHGNPAP